MSSIPFLTAQPFEHVVNGVSCKFYPITFGTTFKLREPAKAILKALSGLMTNRREDVGRESVETTAPDGGRQTRVTVQPIAVDLARMRADQTQSLLADLVMTVMSDGNATMLALLIMDSMRDTYPPEKRKNQIELQRFVEETPATIVVEMLMGVAKANAKLFDPLKGWVATLNATLRDSLGSLVQAVQESVPQQQPPQEATTTASG